jgi:hypothetical protein
MHKRPRSSNSISSDQLFSNEFPPAVGIVGVQRERVEMMNTEMMKEPCKTTVSRRRLDLVASS